MREEVGEELDHDPHDPDFQKWLESRREEETQALGRHADYEDDDDKAIMKDWRKEKPSIRPHLGYPPRLSWTVFGP